MYNISAIIRKNPRKIGEHDKYVNEMHEEKIITCFLSFFLQDFHSPEWPTPDFSKQGYAVSQRA